MTASGWTGPEVYEAEPCAPSTTATGFASSSPKRRGSVNGSGSRSRLSACSGSTRTATTRSSCLPHPHCFTVAHSKVLAALETFQQSAATKQCLLLLVGSGPTGTYVSRLHHGSMQKLLVSGSLQTEELSSAQIHKTRLAALYEHRRVLEIGHVLAEAVCLHSPAYRLMRV